MNRFYKKPKPETMKKNREFYQENFNDEIEWFKENLELIKGDKFLMDMYLILITGNRKMTPKMVDAVRKGMKNPMYNNVTRIERMEKIKPILEKIHMVKSIVQEKDKDKNTVISLREIGEGKISIKSVEDSAINKLRKVQSEPTELEDLEVEQDDDFDKIYRGEISKSGAAILPSKRVRKIPEKIISTQAEENTEKDESENEVKTESESAEKK